MKYASVKLLKSRNKVGVRDKVRSEQLYGSYGVSELSVICKPAGCCSMVNLGELLGWIMLANKNNSAKQMGVLAVRCYWSACGREELQTAEPYGSHAQAGPFITER